jgi:hypothetical protein
MVSLRGPSAKHFWDGLEEFGEVLEDLDIDIDAEEVENV